ncbi:hypothetical protein P67b_00077 [Ruegeria phage Tedan]|nr:hypothetical protein P67b_00077 [Ruegeria phage Tedan]
MYLSTNIQEVQAAFDGAAPRPVEEIWREAYPDATIDSWGRAHAPHDGYTTPEGQTFRGGEYLPEPEALDDGEKAFKRMMAGGRIPTMQVFDVKTRRVLTFQGTKGQRKAAAAICKVQTESFDRTRSFVGEEKKREEFELTIFSIFTNMGMYGTEYTHYMRDADLNPVVYRGTKELGRVNETVKVKATVSAHWHKSLEDGQIFRTYIKRPAAVK